MLLDCFQNNRNLELAIHIDQSTGQACNDLALNFHATIVKSMHSPGNNDPDMVTPMHFSDSLLSLFRLLLSAKSWCVFTV
jgi:hypothetical protein